MLVIYCDGGSRGNPGPAASAFVVTNDKVVIHKQGKYLGTETNNVAEYTAVLMALGWLIKEETNKHSLLLRSNRDVIFNLDSQLIERQINGFYKVKNEKLKILFNEVKEKISKLECKVKFMWNYRTDNELADTLVNEELDRVAMK